ncbi:DnaJ sub C member 8 [Microbotryomycetes sp. JL201]|nr:DnaJ sub C member 8 [Microbotryomycetes sp. JL201]
MATAAADAKATASTIDADAAVDSLFDDGELERILNQEASTVTREAEVLRVLKAFKMNAYEILELDWMPNAGVTDADIQKSYRKRSLLIHPDKLQHPRGIEAFDLLKKASGELLDADKRKALDETLQDARMLVLRAEGLPRDTPDNHEKVKAMKNPDFKERVRIKAKEIIIDEELRRRRVTKMTMIAEGAEAKRQEDALAERKRKIEDKQRWEGQHSRRPSVRLAVVSKRPIKKEEKVERTRASHPGLSEFELIKKVEFQLLASNLSTSVMLSSKLLPAPDDVRIQSSFSRSRKSNDKSSFTKAEKVVLFPSKRDAVLVQINKVDDISHSALDMLDTLNDQRERKEKAERLARNPQLQRMQQAYDGPQIDDPPRTFKRGSLKFKLSDGHHEIDAFELKQIDGIDLEKLQLGCKLLIHNVKVVRGILMLTPDSVEIKGGLIQELHDEAQEDFEDTLRSRLGMEPLDRQARREQEANRVPSAEVIAVGQETAVIGARSGPPPQNAPLAISKRSQDEFDLVMDDDDDLDLDAIAAIEEAALATRKAPPRSTTRQSRPKPFVSQQELAELEVIDLSSD